MLLKLRKAGPVSSNLYQWTVGKQWYWINRKNMTIKGDLKLQAALFNAMLRGLIANVKGSYDRVQKKLRLIL